MKSLTNLTISRANIADVETVTLTAKALKRLISQTDSTYQHDRGDHEKQWIERKVERFISLLKKPKGIKDIKTAQDYVDILREELEYMEMCIDYHVWTKRHKMQTLETAEADLS
jgi:hypothetical protein